MFLLLTAARLTSVTTSHGFFILPHGTAKGTATGDPTAVRAREGGREEGTVVFIWSRLFCRFL